jgi:plasmid stabilization system protein ParE
MGENEFEGKPINILPECEEMVKEALDYMAANSPRQAEIMEQQFFEAVRLLKKVPWIGIPYKEGMRNIKLGKFRYNIYYRENEDNIDILGIWHTSRGTEFDEQ